MVREQSAIGASIASTVLVSTVSIAGHSMLGAGARFSSGRLVISQAGAMTGRQGIYISTRSPCGRRLGQGLHTP
jgi:hypothetical protein